MEPEPPLDGPVARSAEPAVRRALAFMLRDLRPDGSGPRVYGGSSSWKVEIPWGAPLPWEMSFVLGDIAGCPDYGRGEKLAWEYGVRFDDVRLTVAFQKFGMRVYVDSGDVADDREAQAVADRLRETVVRTLPLLRRSILTDIANNQVDLGLINVENHWNDLDSQYGHFSRLSLASAQAAGEAENSRDYELAWQLRATARYEQGAAVTSFFSALEHLLLIQFLLIGAEASGGRLASFLREGWSVKFLKTVGLTSGESKRHYDRLVRLHDELRSPSVHGAVSSTGADFHFLLPGVGPVPTSMVWTAASKRRYRWASAAEHAVLDELHESREWLATGPLGCAVLYGESGLPLFFTPSLRDDLVAAAASGTSELTDCLDALSRMVDDAANMDF